MMQTVNSPVNEAENQGPNPDHAREVIQCTGVNAQSSRLQGTTKAFAVYSPQTAWTEQSPLDRWTEAST